MEVALNRLNSKKIKVINSWQFENLFIFYLFFLPMDQVFFLRYDRNSNLNSHTQIFEDPEDWTHTLIEEWSFLGRGITTGLNTQVAPMDQVRWWAGGKKLIIMRNDFSYLKVLRFGASNGAVLGYTLSFESKGLGLGL